MTGKVTNILVVGVGGQGTILASKIMTRVLLGGGWDVKMAEVHGMAQRGGSVVTQVRFGPQVFSPVIRRGESHFLLAFEKLESVRWLEYLKPGGTAIVNDLELPPMSVLTGREKYPQDIFPRLENWAGQVIMVPAHQLARSSGSTRSQNIVLLGVLARFLQLPQQDWEQVIREQVPPNTVAANLAAFQAGWQLEN